MIEVDRKLRDMAIVEAVVADKTEIVRTPTKKVGEIIFKKKMLNTETKLEELVSYISLVIAYDVDDNAESITKTVLDINAKYAY